MAQDFISFQWIIQSSDIPTGEYENVLPLPYSIIYVILNTYAVYVAYTVSAVRFIWNLNDYLYLMIMFPYTRYSTLYRVRICKELFIACI